MSEEPRMFTQDEVTAIVKKRLRSAKEEALNATVVVEMLRDVLQRLDAIEEEMKR